MNRILVTAAVLTWAMLPNVVAASSFGYLGNFDVINDTGQPAYGFEIELEGLHSSDITDVFGGPGRGFPTGRGYDPATSVVDSYGRSHDHENLFVVGSPTLPTGGTTNGTLTFVALALRSVERLAPQQ